jgi:hypothetical protein
VPLKFREFCVTLRHERPEGPAVYPNLTAVVSAEDAAGAKREAEKIVEMLMGLVAIVSIEPRDQSDQNC